uniref:Ig-like domain-containing protein n=1 Tax=Sphaeramia orbicularis TaxID=375764 RepID=A0A673CNE8_9TELE
NMISKIFIIQYHDLFWSVTFTTSLKPTDGPFLALTWSFNGTINVITSATADVVGQGYENRIELDKATGSLTLRNLTEKDSGTYEVIIIPFGAVQTQMSKPTINCPTGNVIEGQASLNLTCKSDGAVSRKWMKDGKPLVAGGKFNFYDGGRVLSISPVDRTDTGAFYCNVSNGVSFDTATCSITVFYGPDRPTIIQKPIGAELEDSVTLFCSADSRPPAKFTWIFKNMHIFGPIHYIPEMEFRHLGRYTCKAHNTVTGQEALLYFHQSFFVRDGLHCPDLSGTHVGVKTAFSGNQSYKINSTIS